MEPKVITSEKYSLSLRDYAKSLIMAVGSAVLSAIYDTIQKEGDLSKLNWKLIGITAISTAIMYLFKNGILEPPKSIVITQNNTEAKQATKDIKEAVK